MKLFNLFKKTEKTGLESTVESEEILENGQAGSGDEDIETELSLHEQWNLTQEQEYVFRFLANELEPLKPNQISLSGIDIDFEPANDSWLVKSFFRSSLDQAITVGTIELLLLDAEGNTAASAEFDLNELGEIPARSARPWVFVFEKKDQLAEEIPTENWKLAFNVHSMMPHQLELAPSWEEQLPAEQKEALADIVEGLPKLKPREVNIAGFQIQKQDDGNIAASVFVRNGHSKQINIEKLPLELIDATGELVARGTFDLKPPLSVKANSTTPWTFIYPKELIVKAEPDFSRWTIRVPQDATN
ncbi:accessory Sec system S-layer assembly protein [Sporosarcina sp. P37]|uniref:accessory Sec system S-layer assembly protein n=1 Tax=unclassified Sporosarcina TaxID=2647733 RepID=UPI000A17D680|nr:MULTISPECIES: accessory Sec system S-layer assembly protein [unclassified Sporosarcina]ARK25478.1 accessory Sec system S-layer assembly protein [Sporosarcina sp. P37]PID17991.1 accessory Sec system S-layer assembly protein [Sporosarcina sp. P35]